jgi:hypothetical protein
MHENLKKLLCEIKPLTDQLENHSIYSNVQNSSDLQIFMNSHVYAVWDFMSLLKYLQHYFAPSTFPWTPGKHQSIIRFINEIVVAEESDELPDGTFMSHFELYCKAMNEIQLDTKDILGFSSYARLNDLQSCIEKFNIPSPAINFIRKTFDFINTNQSHVIASAFSFGRENIIPEMFQKLLDDMKISKENAPYFHYYLQRHIDIDGDEHGPISLKMISSICGDDQSKWNQVTQASINSIKNRITFWDEIENLIIANRTQTTNFSQTNNLSSQQI